MIHSFGLDTHNASYPVCALMSGGGWVGDGLLGLENMLMVIRIYVSKPNRYLGNVDHFAHHAYIVIDITQPNKNASKNIAFYPSGQPIVPVKMPTPVDSNGLSMEATNMQDIYNRHRSVMHASTFVFSPTLKAKLDSPGRHHLLSQVVLVFSDRAIPSADRLVLTYHDVFCDLVEQSGIMLGKSLEEMKEVLTGNRERQLPHHL